MLFYCSPSKKFLSFFEHLSNEVIYEIFDFLNHFHVYNAFFNLNDRFRHLLTHSNLPINLNLSSISKSNWKRYSADIIEDNLHRISTLRIFNPCIHDFVLPSLDRILPLNRVGRLILKNIEFKCLENLFNRLLSLSQLSSLTITTADDAQENSNTYQLIFRLPALKYCKLSLLGYNRTKSLPICTNEYSPIEHLIITNVIPLEEEFDGLLSYVPRLRRLSLQLADSPLMRKPKHSLICKQLTHISLQLGSSIKFDTFQEVVREIFPMIEVLSYILHCPNRSIGSICKCEAMEAVHLALSI